MQLGMAGVGDAAAKKRWDLDESGEGPLNGVNGHERMAPAEHGSAERTLPLRPLEFVVPVSEAQPPIVGSAVVKQAEQPEVKEKKKRSLMHLGRKEIQPLRVKVEPGYLHFGEVRKGDERKQAVKLRFEGGQGKVNGRVASGPA